MIQSAGPMGYLYFGALYVIAEVLAIPALPLTASSGYLFGLVGGTTVVICSATIAAGISFLLGRTFLRKWVEELLGDNAKFKAIDSAIGREGFKIILLLRLSPIFPFAISNYLYGITSVPFWEYLGASMLGFLPGTIAYVYGGGQLGSLVDGGDGGGLPWYGYALGLVAVAATIKLVGDIATKAVAEIEPGIMEEQEWD
ncbi:snare associated Golgi protein-domain-containing protein [Tribonema minus]|uniref:Snare associated Golgi protein-domain-containing protein n=1 Tax=Tribonema minus TaxID=303371 RepID=A0A835ZF34_9STRA|nr:snare associated Golgi protein-domain-containing protein [Tribonema minus]